jgi:hypothetical protein
MRSDSSYEMARDAPPPFAWPAYKRAVRGQLSNLLKSGVCDERTYHRFLELHPSVLPWFYGTFGAGHHGLIHGSIITQPRLPALRGKQPDFMMITHDSGSVYAVLVEIESPCKRWFTGKGQPRADLTQAINQLREWKAWFNGPGNDEKFVDEYRVPFSLGEHRFGRHHFEQRYILIYGRRAELTASGYAHMRSRHQQPDERILSYDHLIPNENLKDAVTVRVDGNGYEAVSIPPTLSLGPFQASDLVQIRAKEDVVRANPLMEIQRAEFLSARFSYWDAWAQSDDRGAQSFDEE